MKAVILAGGLGTRISEETAIKPKPMVEIGGKPILWHILKIYSHYNIRDFIVCCGYKSYVIKEYFANYFLHNSDVTFDLHHNEMHVHGCRSEPWRVTLVDTGDETMTGGRLLRVADHLRGEDSFCVTYGDGLSDINIADLVSFHRSHGKVASIVAAQPESRFGVLSLDVNRVTAFTEKPKSEVGLINGGFFIFKEQIFDYLHDDASVLEQTALQGLVNDGQLMAYEHHEFWQPMDTLRDKNLLEKAWASGRAPWKVWDEGPS
jgi:glucose-1-phosphate cytidylyltransferase